MRYPAMNIITGMERSLIHSVIAKISNKHISHKWLKTDAVVALVVVYMKLKRKS